MADFTLEDGREINFDLMKINVKEYRALFNKRQPEAEETATLAKVTGLDAKELVELPLLEWKRMTKAFILKCVQPLADPN